MDPVQKSRLEVNIRPFELGMGQELVRMERELVEEGKPVMTTLLDLEGQPKAARVFVAVALLQGDAAATLTIPHL